MFRYCHGFCKDEVAIFNVKNTFLKSKTNGKTAIFERLLRYSKNNVLYQLVYTTGKISNCQRIPKDSLDTFDDNTR
jgi:hypothetical protein